MMTFLITTLLFAQTPATSGVETLGFDQARLASIEKVEVQVTEDGKKVTYSGIPLASLLKSGSKTPSPMADLRNLSDSVILVRGDDGYQAAVSAAAVAMDPKGERFLLALTREAKPLEAGVGPVRLIVPGDPKHVRWVKGVATIRLVRLDQLVPAP